MPLTKAKPKLKKADLDAANVLFDAHGASEKMGLYRYTEEDRDYHIVGFRNLYAITRYNQSLNYALVIAKLAQRIDE